jgi:hypothetical protein
MRNVATPLTLPGRVRVVPGNGDASTEGLIALKGLNRANVEAPFRRQRPTPSWAVLLERFYQRTGLPMPQIEQLEGDAVPEPYRSLLVHSTDMTPTLEGFYRQPMGLTVLSREIEGESYLREVVLRVADAETSGQRPREAVPAASSGAAQGAGGAGWPVEYGVIRICLGHLAEAARRRVLEEQRPLGNILQSEGIPHISWPQAFFRLEPDAHTGAVLRLRQPCDLYGRRNVLLDGSRKLLAEVIEILAPIASSQPSA